MNNFYFHQQLASVRSHDNIRPYRMPSPSNHLFVCLTNGSCIEFHQIVSTGLMFHSRYQFNCTISKIQILPSKHHQSDFVWVLDELGRYACWRPLQGYELVQNCIVDETSKPQLKDSLKQENNIVFSGANYQFQQNNTEGTIFYLIRSKFILLHFTINKQGIFIDQTKVLTYQFPYQWIRHVGWVSSQAMFLLGVIEEFEGRTILKVHDLQLGLGLCVESVQWQLEKNNLLQFYPGQNGNVLILTFNEVSLYHYKISNPTCNYRTRGNYGQGCYLGQGFYAHIGEELTVFSQDKLKTYRKLKFQEEALMKENGLVTCNYLGKFLNDGQIVAITTIDRGLYLLVIYPSAYTIFRRQNSLNSILSIQPINSDCFSVVSNSIGSKTEVYLLQWKHPLSLLVQQQFQFIIQNLVCVSGGSYIIIMSKEINAVFRLRRQRYQFYFSLPYQAILSVSDKFLVTENGLYQIDYQSQTYYQLVQANLLLAKIMQQCIYYLDEQGCLWVYQDDGQKLAVSQDRHGDYCWAVILQIGTLICANLYNHNFLTLINTQAQKRLYIKGHTLVSSIVSVCTYIGREALRLCDTERYHVLVGYLDGAIHLHSQQSILLHVFQYFGAQLIRFTHISQQCFLVSSGRRQYWMTCSQQKRQLKQISLSNSQGYIVPIAYLSKSQQIVCLENHQFSANKFIRVFKLQKANICSSICNHRVVSLSRVAQFQNQIPLILIIQQKLFVAAARSLSIYSIKTKRQISRYTHQLSQVISLKPIDLGLLLCGTTNNDKEVVLVISQSMQLVCKFTLGTKKHLKAIQTVPKTNQFFIRYDTFVALYKITASLQLTQLLGSNTNMQGYQLDINIQTKTILINDPFRYLALFQYQHSIIFKASYIPAVSIKYSLYFGHILVIVDERGQLTLLSQHYDNLIPSKVNFVKMGTLDLGEAVTALCKFGQSIYYGTTSGKIGYLSLLDKEQYDILHKLQDESLSMLKQGHRFCYRQWRSRMVSNQRLIDANLLYLHLNEDMLSLKQKLGQEKLDRVMPLFEW